MRYYYYKCSCGNKQNLGTSNTGPIRCPICKKITCLRCGSQNYCNNCIKYVRKDEILKLEKLSKYAPFDLNCSITCCCTLMLSISLPIGLINNLPAVWIGGIIGIIAVFLIMIPVFKKGNKKEETYLQYYRKVFQNAKDRMENSHKSFQDNQVLPINDQGIKSENIKICQKCKEKNPIEGIFCINCGNKIKY